MGRAFTVFLCLTIVLCAVSSYGDTPASSDREALSLASRSIAALGRAKTIQDVTLVGSVTWRGGSDVETGSATLMARATGESRIDLTLSSGTRSEIRSIQAGMRTGRWINPDKTSGVFAPHNCQTDPIWFFPALGSLTMRRQAVLSYVGRETRGDATVEHIRSSVREPASHKGRVSLEELSTIDFYLDAESLLPVAVSFNEHPDDDAGTDLLTEVRFADYKVIEGVLLPTHIQKFSEGSLLMDITVTSASFNTGLGSANFTTN